jgi:hypothetical protein
LGTLNTVAAVSVAVLAFMPFGFAVEPELPHPIPNPSVVPRWEDEIVNGYLP